VVQDSLLTDPNSDKTLEHRSEIGRGYALDMPRGPRSKVTLYHRGTPIKQANLADKSERRVFVVELMQKGVNQSHLAKTLKLSRQTLHNYRESYQRFGLEGLLHGYNPDRSISRETQRRLHVEQRRPGSKARELEKMRRQQREQAPQTGEADLGAPHYELQEPPVEALVSEVADKPEEAATTPAAVPEELPYAEDHQGQPTRYAGVFILLFPLLSQWRWLPRICSLFGDGWRLFMVFLLMSALNIRSIEQLKHIRRDEAGKILGLGRLPSLPKIWEWFYTAAQKQRSGRLLDGFFQDQLQRGLVCGLLWFTDGHLLPYTGREKVHYSYHTQRRMPVAGQTNLVTCDERGRIVRFEIQEGKGDLRGGIVDIGEYGRQQLGVAPIQVFDREGHGVDFFARLVNQRIPFITWEKHADTQRLMGLGAERFTHTLELNGKTYQILEEEKSIHHQWLDEAGEEQEHRFNLRRIVLWNQSSNRRASGLCWDDGRELELEMIARGILSRWGASENTFKHIQERHPYHYHPGFGVQISEDQEIANPRCKELATQIQSIETRLGRCRKQLCNTQPRYNKDGTLRANCKHQRLQQEIRELETQQKQLRDEKAGLAERIDVNQLQDYRSFQKIDNEGKNLFDFVTTSVWNARRQLIDWLADVYPKESDRVDLFYAILHSHGWIRSDPNEVVVRLEPLQQPRRRYAQEQLCRKLTGLGAKIPGGKWLRIEVGESPL